MKTIYLAGAMGCYGENQDIPRAWRLNATKWVTEHSDNFKCINPMDYFEYGKHYHLNENEPMRFDLYKVAHSDVVLVNMERLNESLGTSDEILYAFLKGIPIVGFYQSDSRISPENFDKYFHPWKIEQINRIETGANAMLMALMYIEDYYR